MNISPIVDDLTIMARALGLHIGLNISLYIAYISAFNTTEGENHNREVF